MEWDFVLGLAAITLLVIGLVIYVGTMLSRAVQNHFPDSDMAISITPTGSVLFACTVGFWVVCLVARAIESESTFGMFLRGTDGIATVLVGSVAFCGVAAAVLAALGYPIAKRGGGGA
jgi:hypothetical protein